MDFILKEKGDIAKLILKKINVGVSYGPTTAAADAFKVKIEGKGGHGAYPHLSVDPITTAADMINTLQKIVSREISPNNPVVVTVGKIQGGTAVNIIPKTVEFAGTIRSMYPKDREYIEKRFHEICNYIAKANKTSVEIEYIPGYPSCITNEDFTRLLAESASKIIGEENVSELKEPDMGVDDMAYYMEKVPGTYFYLGTGNVKKGAIYAEHHPKFNIDEDTLHIGTAIYVQTILDFFNKWSKQSQ